MWRVGLFLDQCRVFPYLYELFVDLFSRSAARKVHLLAGLFLRQGEIGADSVRAALA